MIQVLVSCVMWTLVASLLILRRGRTDHSITYASAIIAFSMTLNIDPVYLAIDPLFGGTNLITLAGDALLMIGLYFLGRGVLRAGEYRPRPVRISISMPTLVIALVCVTTMFSFADRGTTTTTFMSDYGHQPLAGAYSITVFTYCGVVLAAMLALAISQYRIAKGALRVPAALLAIGSACGLALCLSVLIMDVTHIVGALELMRFAEATYGPLTLATFAFLCVGFIAQPATRSLLRRLRGVRTDAFVMQLDPIWRDATKLRPGLSDVHESPGIFEEPEAKLHRHVVEIRDAMIDPRVNFEIDPADRALLERAESHLLGKGRMTANTATLDATSLGRGQK